MKKTIVILIMILSVALFACTPAATTPTAIEVDQPPVQTQEEKIQPTAVPTQASTNTQQPIEIPPTPTEENKTAPAVFMTSNVSLEDLANKLTIYETMQQGNPDTFSRFLESSVFGGLFLDFTDAVKPITVFVPMYTQKFMDENFQLKDENSKVQYTEALLYHTVPGLYLETDLLKLDGKTIPSRLEGKEITISVKDGVVYLNGIGKIIQSDILAENSIIFVIDTFLIPPAD